MSDAQTILLNTPADRATLIGFVNGLPRDRKYKVTVKETRGDRSAAQQSYYFACIAGEFMRYQRDESQERTFSVLDAHEVLKRHCLAAREIMHPRTGRPMAKLPGHLPADMLDMAKYIDACRDWLMRELGVGTQDPDPDWKATALKARARKHHPATEQASA